MSYHCTDCTHCGRMFTPDEPRQWLAANPKFQMCLDERACKERQNNVSHKALLECADDDSPQYILSRSEEKQASRDQDVEDLKSGKITNAELRECNGHFAVDAKIDLDQEDF